MFSIEDSACAGANYQDAIYQKFLAKYNPIKVGFMEPVGWDNKGNVLIVEPVYFDVRIPLSELIPKKFARITQAKEEMLDNIMAYKVKKGHTLCMHGTGTLSITTDKRKDELVISAVFFLAQVREDLLDVKYRI